MSTTPTMVSPQMERIAKRLAAVYEMDWMQKGAYLMLAMPERPECWLLMNLDRERFSVTCCLVGPDNSLIPEVDMIFAMHPTGWEPIELLYSNEAFTTYVQETQAEGISLYDTEGNLRFDHFTEYFAQLLEAQGWLAQAHRLPDQESDGRMAGCLSTHRIDGYRHVGHCVGCGKTIDCAEGAGEYPELCEECWALCRATLTEWETQAATLHHHSLSLVCACPEQCSTVLQLTHDGFLIVEDKDGLRVSFMLPDWLDFAIRRALLMHAATDEAWAEDQAQSDLLGRLADDVPF